MKLSLLKRRKKLKLKIKRLRIKNKKYLSAKVVPKTQYDTGIARESSVEFATAYAKLVKDFKQKQFEHKEKCHKNWRYKAIDEMPALILIDATNLFYRAYYAARSKNADSRGKKHFEIRIFLGMLMRLMRNNGTAASIACWDTGESQYRKEIYPDYKGTRKRDPVVQKQMLKMRMQLQELLPKIGVLSLALPNVEADDIIAFMYRIYRGKKAITVVSGDSDLSQFYGTVFLQPNLHGSYIHKNICRLEAAKTICSKIIIGDKGDNINGIVGIGPKRFDELFKSGLLSMTDPKSFNSEIDKHGLVKYMIGHFALKSMESAKLLIRNSKLVDLVKHNKEIIGSDEQKFIVGRFVHYHKNVKPIPQYVMAVVSKLGLGGVFPNGSYSISAQVLETNAKNSRNLVRHTLRLWLDSRKRQANSD